MTKSSKSNLSQTYIYNIFNKVNFYHQDHNDFAKFEKANKRVLEYAKAIGEHLLYWEVPSIVPLICSAGLSVKRPKNCNFFNNLMLISSKGAGKTALFEHVLAKNNPKFFKVLPEKMFESALVQQDRRYYDNKVLICSDMIPSFQGLNAKQKSQLTSFWSEIIKGHYTRSEKGRTYNIGSAKKPIRTVVLFGIAKENYTVHRKDLFESTFFERFPPMEVKFDDKMKQNILKYRTNVMMKDEKQNLNLPRIKLPLKKKPVTIKFTDDKEVWARINKLALERDVVGVQSCTRSQDYIVFFMMCNAFLNGRRKTSYHDLYMYELIHKYFLEASWSVGVESDVLKAIKMNPFTKDKDLINDLPMTKKTFYKYKKILKRKGLI